MTASQSLLPPRLEDSKTHRLVHCTGAPNDGFVVVHEAVADELEELRAAFQFLFPQRGQDRFQLLRPDRLDVRWVVYDRNLKSVYAYGATPRIALTTASRRLVSENNFKNDPNLKLESSSIDYHGE